METVPDFIFGGSKITADDDCSHEIKRPLLLGRKAMTNLDSILKSRNITLPMWMWELDYKKAEHWRIDAFELWCWRGFFRVSWSKGIKLLNPKGNQPYIFIGRIDAEADTPILRPPDVKSWLIGKDPDAGKDWRQGENRVTEDEMIGWHHQLNGHEFG